ncbi:MAG: hypothetical protein IJU79_02220 [Desulfovibrionaceae bacterium]|nr:hypothetical protein [Desulfovibrionaceae bacterium]
MDLSTNEKVLVYAARAIKEIDPDFDIHEFSYLIYKLGCKHKAMPDFLETICSWGDDLEDEDVAVLLNRQQSYLMRCATERLTKSLVTVCRADCSQR